MTNLNQIAETLGISKTTISFVLNGRAEEKHISSATANKIIQYCRKIGYRPNIHASRTSQKVVRNVMVLLQNSYKEGDQDPFADYNVARVVGGITQAATAAGYDFIIRSFSSLPTLDTIFDYFRSKAIDGMIFYGSSIPEEWCKVAIKENRMIAGISIEPKEGIKTVNVDNFKVCEELGKYLNYKNCQNIFYINGVPSFVANQRKEGFFKGCKDRFKIVEADGDFTEKSGFLSTINFLSSNPLPDAIVCANDKMLLGAIAALKSKNIDTTKLILAGGDNIEAIKYIDEKLLTFDYQADRLGRCAMELVMKMIYGQKCQDIVLETNIIKHNKWNIEK